MARYLVTGGAGFIGSHIAERLVREGHTVRVLDNLSVGRRDNLEAVRDFLDVRDAVEALLLLAEKGQPGEAYNICSGTGTSVSDLLQAVIAAAGVPAEVYRDPKLCRPLDDPVTVGNRSLLSALGWQPKTTIREMVRDTLEFWHQEAVHATQGAV